MARHRADDGWWMERKAQRKVYQSNLRYIRGVDTINALFQSLIHTEQYSFFMRISIVGREKKHQKRICLIASAQNRAISRTFRSLVQLLFFFFFCIFSENGNRTVIHVYLMCERTIYAPIWSTHKLLCSFWFIRLCSFLLLFFVFLYWPVIDELIHAILSA